ncbi:MAG: DUF438 domain-containing protein [Clostridia bacterium]
MSESINNREYRKETIKQVIKELHQGKSVDEVKGKFEDAFAGVSAKEISEAEQALINEGLPVEEVQKLCDVHAAVFKGSIAEIHQVLDQTEVLGHPANSVKRENRALEELIAIQVRPYLAVDLDQQDLVELARGIEELATKLNIHYLKKENLFFPYMEQYGITAPPKVMWGVDDEIRAGLKLAKAELSGAIANMVEFRLKLESLLERIAEMIFKEESILLPMLMETLTLEDWGKIATESKDFGYLVAVPDWNPTAEQPVLKEEQKEIPGEIVLPSGVFKTEELVRMLDTLPFDITFVDKNDTVKYFSQGVERSFPRTKAIIGRNVSNCHPPASVHIVEKIVEDFKSGKKDQEDFWIKMGEKLVLIRYYAVRSLSGEYLGVVEVTQDIKPIQALTGEKRLASL